MATSSKKTASKQANSRLVDNEELAELVKLAVAEAMKEAIPKFVEDVVAQLSAKTQAMVAEQMAEFRSEMLTMRADSARCMECVETNETQLSAVDSRLSAKVSKLTALCTSLEDKLTDMEDRSRRDNVRVHGIPESTETSNPLAYLSSAIPKWFPELGSVEIMRAHRVGAEKLDANGKPTSRTLLLKLLRFTDRDRILGAARKTTVEVDGTAIRFAPDYSTRTFRRRLAFSDSMDALQRLGFRTFLLYPARLKATRGGTSHFFNVPEEAKDFMESLNAD